MFLFEDSKILSVSQFPEKGNNPSFVNISSIVVYDT